MIHKTAKVHTIFSGFLIFSTFNCYAGGGLNLLGNIEKNKLSVFIAGGVAKADVDTSLASSITLSDGTLDDSGKLLEFGIGYQYNKNIYTTLAIQKSSFDTVDISNVYGSINYQHSFKKAHGFIGVLAGRSNLEWSSTPYPILTSSNLSSGSFIYGFQAGIKKQISKDYSLFIKYQHIEYDHIIELLNNTSNIEHDSSQNLLLGLSYSF